MVAGKLINSLDYWRDGLSPARRVPSLRVLWQWVECVFFFCVVSVVAGLGPGSDLELTVGILHRDLV